MSLLKIEYKSSTIDTDSKLEFAPACGAVFFSLGGIPSGTDLLVGFGFGTTK